MNYSGKVTPEWTGEINYRRVRRCWGGVRAKGKRTGQNTVVGGYTVSDVKILFTHHERQK